MSLRQGAERLMTGFIGAAQAPQAGGLPLCLMLQALRADFAATGSEELVRLCVDLENRFRSIAATPDIEMRRAEDAFIQEFEDLTLRMVAVASAAGLNPAALLEKAIASHPKGNGLLRPEVIQGEVVTRPGPVNSADVLGAQVILLPEIQSVEHCWKVLDSLSDVYLSTSHTQDWIIDFSALIGPQPLLLTNLLGYQRDFASSNRGIYLIWLRPLVLQGPGTDRIREAFELDLIGNFYLSRPHRL